MVAMTHGLTSAARGTLVGVTSGSGSEQYLRDLVLLRRVRDRHLRLLRQRVDRALPLREQIDELEPAGRGERLGDPGELLVDADLGVVVTHSSNHLNNVQWRQRQASLSKWREPRGTRSERGGTCYPWIVPLARILVFVLALTHAVGLADLLLGDACEEWCSDDGCATDCPPGLECRCHCPSATPMIRSSIQTVTAIATPHEVASYPAEQRMHASPDPREILHVPKHAV